MPSRSRSNSSATAATAATAKSAPGTPAPSAPPTPRQLGGAPAPTGPPPFSLAGGARITQDGTLNAPDVLLALVLIVGVAQAHLIPSDIHRFTDTILGRIILFAIAIAMTAWKGWVIGLLTALFVLRLLMHTSRAETDVADRFTPEVQEMFSSPVTIEKFQDQIKAVTKNKDDEKKHRWFVEKVFNEEPDWIETEKVKTQAVTGN
jgi:hypothetical protein